MTHIISPSPGFSSSSLASKALIFASAFCAGAACAQPVAPSAEKTKIATRFFTITTDSLSYLDRNFWSTHEDAVTIQAAISHALKTSDGQCAQETIRAIPITTQKIAPKPTAPPN